MQMNKNYVKGYCDEVITSINKLPMEKVEKIARILYMASVKNKNIILMGNGGSAATASHFVCDLVKGLSMPGKKRFKAIALCDNVSTMMAYANDCSYEMIFQEQLKSFAKKGDVVIGISASGNSKNVLNAIKVANKLGATTIGLTGFKGGKLKFIVSECVIVPSDSMERIEDIHLVILHAIKLYLLKLMK